MGIGSTARKPVGQQIVYHRREFTFAQPTSVIAIGEVPAGSLIMKPISGVFVDIVFNAGTNNFLDIGTAAVPAALATDLSLLATVFVPLDIDTGPPYLTTVDAMYFITMQLSGTAATTGHGTCVLCYIPPDETP